MLVDVVSIRLLQRVLRKRNVGSLGVQGIGRRVVQRILHEGQLMGVEARLSRYLAGRDGAGFHLKMSFVMGGEDALDVDHSTLRVTRLDDGSERPADGVGRRVVVVVADFAASRFGAANVEAVGAAIL